MTSLVEAFLANDEEHLRIARSKVTAHNQGILNSIDSQNGVWPNEWMRFKAGLGPRPNLNKVLGQNALRFKTKDKSAESDEITWNY